MKPLARLRLDGGPMGGVFYSPTWLRQGDPLPEYVDIPGSYTWTEINSAGTMVERQMSTRYELTGEMWNGWPIYRHNPGHDEPPAAP